MRTSLVLALALAAAACGPSNGGSGNKCKGDFVPGDLVLTEVMANPAGEDTGNEWFELQNASGRTVDLTGLVLVSSRSDGTDETTHEVEYAAAVAPGAYFVVGNMAADLLPAWADYGYDTGLGDLRNDAGRLALRCDETEVDHIVYGAADSGVSQSLTSAVAPDYLANDEPANWCNSTVQSSAGQFFGSPGEANEACPGGPLPSECTDPGTGAKRALVPLAAGDVVLTELMQNPKRAADTAAEWIEIYVTRDVDLNGLSLGTTVGTPKATLADAACLRATAGSYLVLSHSTDTALNGGLPGVDYTFAFGLTNSGGSLYLGSAGNVLDQISWATSFDGFATGLDPNKTDTAQNDDPLNWCKATATYGLGDSGSPGAANPTCPIVVPEGKCLDGGVQRDIVPPAAGQLVITEFMANPKMVGDTAGEWFEVLVTGDLDLNGLQLGNTPPTVGTTLKAAECLHVAAGTYLVFAKSDDPTANGGLPRVDYATGLSIANTAGGLWVGRGGTVLDQITYAATTEGVASALKPTLLTPADNDVAANWCAAVATYGSGDKGTPGAANSACP